MENKKQETQKVQKPLCLEMRDIKAELVKIIGTAMQERQIPAYILSGIIQEIYEQIKKIEADEIAYAEKIYAESLSNNQTINEVATDK